MGCLNFRDDEESRRSQIIDSQIRQERRRPQEAKILLLGPGESGKSTVFKQFKIIHDDGGFSANELMGFRHVVFTNCISQMRVLITAAIRKKQPFQNSDSIQLAKLLASLPEAGNVWTPEVGLAIKRLWADKGIREVFKGAGKSFHLNDTAAYFLDNIDRFIPPDYVPTVADALRVRVMSTGIEEAEFSFDKIIFRVVDVGGQKAERRKWVHCFDSVSAVLFCTSLSGYYQTLREDDTTNRMVDTFALFEETVNNPYFLETAFILFLNKTDLFEEKIKDIPLLTCPCFDDYKGGTDYDSAVTFVKNKFLSTIKEKRNPVHVHFTCALDTKNIKYVVDDVRYVIMEKLTKQILV